MKEYYGELDSMSNRAGGPYRLSSILIKRVRQLVRMSLGAFRSEGFDPITVAFGEYRRNLLQATEERSSEDLLQIKEKKKRE